MGKKDSALSCSKSRKLSLVSVGFFQVIFLYVLIRYYGAIIIVPGRNISFEYWEWWLSQPKPYMGIVDTVEGIADLFLILFEGEILFWIWKNRRKPGILVAAIVLFILAVGLLGGWRYVIVPNLVHYRLFMRYIPGELMAALLLSTHLFDFRIHTSFG